jgi:hypothetical protein
VTIIVATGPKGKLCMEVQIRKYATILLAGLTCRTVRDSKRRVLRAGVIIIGDGAGVLRGHCSSPASNRANLNCPGNELGLRQM